MLKVGMPLPAGQDYMERNRLDSTVLDEDHNKPTYFTDEGVPLKYDPEFIKYVNMLIY